MQETAVIAKKIVTMFGRVMSKQRILVCPICGETQPESSVCLVCGTALNKEGLLLAEGAIGPWWVRNDKFPHNPGMTYDHLAELIRKGEIERHTLLRGPTTRQLWQVARRVPGVAHLLERCYSCGEHVSIKDRSCPKCNVPFLAYRDRNNLGLDDSEPSEGEIDGMSSFLNDTMILNTTSTPLTVPQRKRSADGATGEGGGVGTPEFRALQRQLEATLRTKRNLTIALVISLLILLVLIVFFAK